MKDDEKKPPIATVSRIPRRARPLFGPSHSGDRPPGDWPPPPMPHGPYGAIDPEDPKYIEQRNEADRHVAKSARTHYVEQLAGSMLIASIKAGREMTPATCVVKANEMADALGMGIAECDKQ